MISCYLLRSVLFVSISIATYNMGSIIPLKTQSFLGKEMSSELRLNRKHSLVIFVGSDWDLRLMAMVGMLFVFKILDINLSYLIEK